MSFEVAADAYDRFMGRFSAPLARQFADWARLDASRALLDVGCGPGALASVLAGRFAAPAVAAVDTSESFVEAARGRLPGVDVRLAGAEELPFADDSFDAALAQLVVHLMADPAAGAREMVRVTRPRGVVAACVWDFAGGRAPHTAFFGAFASVVPGVEDETRRLGVRDGDLVRLLVASGCRDVEQGELTVSVTSPTFEEWWEPYTLGVAPAGRQLATLDAPTRERVRLRALDALGPGPIAIEATAWAARGRA